MAIGFIELIKVVLKHAYPPFNGNLKFFWG